jgi:hypothetical protein
LCSDRFSARRSSVEIALRASSPCLTITTRAGLLRLDSLCGLALRQLEPALALALRPARPNPFETTTRIDYTVMSAGHLRLRIIDAGGVERLRPIDAWTDEGRHTVELDGSQLAKGVYRVLLEAGGGAVTGVLLRQ